ISPIDGVVRRTWAYFHTPVDFTVAFAAQVTPPDVSIASSARTLRPRAHFANQADYDRQTMITYRELGTVVTVAMTDAYATLSGNGYDLVVPDLTGIPGFDERWALHPGIDVGWLATRIGGTLGLGPDARPTDGATARAAELTGTLPASR